MFLEQKKNFLKKNFQKIFGPGRAMGDPPPKGVPDWSVTASEPSQTARTGFAHIKKYVEERELTLMILVDASASVHFASKNTFPGFPRPKNVFLTKQFFCPIFFFWD